MQNFSKFMNEYSTLFFNKSDKKMLKTGYRTQKLNKILIFFIKTLIIILNLQ